MRRFLFGFLRSHNGGRIVYYGPALPKGQRHRRRGFVTRCRLQTAAIPDGPQQTWYHRKDAKAAKKGQPADSLLTSAPSASWESVANGR